MKELFAKPVSLLKLKKSLVLHTAIIISVENMEKIWRKGSEGEEATHRKCLV